MQNVYLTAEKLDKSPAKHPARDLGDLSSEKSLVCLDEPPVLRNDYGDTSLLPEEGQSGSQLSQESPPR